MHCNTGCLVLERCPTVNGQPACCNTGCSTSDCCLSMSEHHRAVAGCKHTSAAHRSAVCICLRSAGSACVICLVSDANCCDRAGAQPEMLLQDPKPWLLQTASPVEQRLPKSAALPGDRLKPGDKHGEQALLEAQPRGTTLVALKAKTQVWQPGL